MASSVHFDEYNNNYAINLNNNNDNNNRNNNNSINNDNDNDNDAEVTDESFFINELAFDRAQASSASSLSSSSSSSSSSSALSSSSSASSSSSSSSSSVSSSSSSSSSSSLSPLPVRRSFVVSDVGVSLCVHLIDCALRGENDDVHFYCQCERRDNDEIIAKKKTSTSNENNANIQQLTQTYSQSLDEIQLSSLRSLSPSSSPPISLSLSPSCAHRPPASFSVSPRVDCPPHSLSLFLSGEPSSSSSSSSSPLHYIYHYCHAAWYREYAFTHALMYRICPFIFAGLMLLLSLFETPNYCSDPNINSPYPCSQFLNDYFIQSYATTLTRTGGLVFELLLLFFMLLHSSVVRLFLFGVQPVYGAPRRWQHLNILHSLVIVVSIIDVVAAMATTFTRVRVSCLMRAPLMLLMFPSIRRLFSTVCIAIINSLEIILLIWIWLILFAWLGYALFFHANFPATGSFDTFQDAMYSVQVLLTTSNFPNVMIPFYSAGYVFVNAYNRTDVNNHTTFIPAHYRVATSTRTGSSRFSFLYFFVFLIASVYFLMPLFLGSLFKSFQDSRMQMLDRIHRNRVKNLHTAFIHLSHPHDRTIDVTVMKRLLTSITASSSSSLSSLYVHSTIATVRDSDRIDFDRFLSIILHMERAVRPVPAQTCMFPACAMRIRGIDACIRFVRSMQFEYTMMFIVMVYAIVVIVDTFITNSSSSSSSSSLFYIVETILLFTFLVEACVKILCTGWRHYVAMKQNQFDGACVVMSIGAFVCISAIQLSRSSTLTLHAILIVVRFARLLRLLVELNSFKVVLHTVTKIGPRALTFFGVILSIFYLFGQIGVMSFGGLVYSSNPLLPHSSYVQSEFFDIHFNDFGSSCVLLFCLLLVNNWNVFVDIYTLLTGTFTTRIFFEIYWMIVVPIIVNCIVSSVLELYFESKEEYEKALFDERQRHKHHDATSLSSSPSSSSSSSPPPPTLTTTTTSSSSSSTAVTPVPLQTELGTQKHDNINNNDDKMNNSEKNDGNNVVNDNSNDTLSKWLIWLQSSSIKQQSEQEMEHMKFRTILSLHPLARIRCDGLPYSHSSAEYEDDENRVEQQQQHQEQHQDAGVTHLALSPQSPSSSSSSSSSTATSASAATAAETTSSSSSSKLSLEDANNRIQELSRELHFLRLENEQLKLQRVRSTDHS